MHAGKSKTPNSKYRSVNTLRGVLPRWMHTGFPPIYNWISGLGDPGMHHAPSFPVLTSVLHLPPSKIKDARKVKNHCFAVSKSIRAVVCAGGIFANYPRYSSRSLFIACCQFLIGRKNHFFV